MSQDEVLKSKVFARIKECKKGMLWCAIFCIVYAVFFGIILLIAPLMVLTVYTFGLALCVILFSFLTVSYHLELKLWRGVCIIKKWRGRYIEKKRF